MKNSIFTKISCDLVCIGQAFKNWCSVRGEIFYSFLFKMYIGSLNLYAVSCTMSE
jgi:hypothetical protein